MRVSVNPKNLEKTLINVIDYSYGFIEGAKKGKKIFLHNLGKNIIFILGKYIDSEAKANRFALHHVYEWYKTGSPSARLFDITYTVSNLGLSFKSEFTQSHTMSKDATAPFYNKAKIMEEGIPVTIKPKKESVLVFEVNGDTVVTPKAVTVMNPGGDEVVGSFERVFDEFMMVYFTQSFLKSSGLFDYLENPKIYKDNFRAGSKMGKGKGVSTGFKFVVNAKIEVE